MAVRDTRQPGGHLRTVPGDARAHRPDREPGGDRRDPLDGRRRERRPADSRRPPVPSGAHHHPLLRIHGLGRDDHRTGRIARMPRNLGQRPLPDPQLDLRLRRQRCGARRKGRAAPADRRTHRRALRRPVGSSGRGVRSPDGREQRQRPLALARGGRRGRAGRPRDRRGGRRLGTDPQPRPRMGAAAVRHRPALRAAAPRGAQHPPPRGRSCAERWPKPRPKRPAAKRSRHGYSRRRTPPTATPCRRPTPAPMPKMPAGCGNRATTGLRPGARQFKKP